MNSAGVLYAAAVSDQCRRVALELAVLRRLLDGIAPVIAKRPLEHVEAQGEAGDVVTPHG
jgi:hypothetical protein